MINIKLFYLLVTLFIVSVTDYHNYQNSKLYTTNKEFQNDTTAFEILRYRHYIKSLEEISINDVEYKINNKQHFILYVGKETCLWCRKLIPILSELISSEEKKIYYLNSQETENNISIKKFREQHKIEYVPSIIVFFEDNTYKTLELNITSNEFNIEYLNKIFDDFNI